MPPKIGYLLPTRERIMGGEPETGSLLALAERAEANGFDSVWVGDSLTARPRHEPFTLLAAVAARTRRVEMGTAVLLPALRNPVILAHSVATLDRISEGRFILGVGVATDVPSIRAEFEAAGVPFEKRAGRMMEGLRLCRALWSGEPVDWNGRWKLESATIGPTPHRPGGPPIWLGGKVPATIERVGKYYDGWFPNAYQPPEFAEKLAEIRTIARESGRDADAIDAATYLTLATDNDTARAERRLDDYLAQYYGERPASMRKRQICYAGPAAGAAAWLKSFADAGATHLVLRFAGDHERNMDAVAGMRQELGW